MSMGVMSSSIAFFATSGISIPVGNPFSLPVDQNRFPGFGAESFVTAGLTGSGEVSAASGGCQ